MNLKNLTPHAVTVCGITIPPEPVAARLATSTKQVDSILMENTDGPFGFMQTIPITKTVFGDATGLPAVEQGTVLIVSQVMASALAGVRNDLVFPNEIERDANGQPVGCNSLGVPTRTAARLSPELIAEAEAAIASGDGEVARETLAKIVEAGR